MRKELCLVGSANKSDNNFAHLSDGTYILSSPVDNAYLVLAHKSAHVALFYYAIIDELGHRHDKGHSKLAFPQLIKLFLSLRPY